MNILYVASEAMPFAASGGLADVSGSLPAAVNKKGHDCRVVIPLYKNIKPDLRAALTPLTSITVDVAWRKQYCGILTTIYNGVVYYFIDNEYYFGRDGMYGFYDDCERFTFFSRAVLEMLRYIDFKPDIIHANDWQTALISVYYQTLYRYQQGFDNIKNLFTVHNIQYQGKYGTEVVNEIMGIPMYHSDLLMYDDCVNMMKGAFEAADRISTVSPSYAWEILDPWYAYGLDRILINKQYKLSGILNGIDTTVYDPEKDPLISANFKAGAHVKGKKTCKDKLLADLGLQEGDEPVVGIVTRFVAHKGLDLIKYIFEEMVDRGFKFAVIGSGEKIFEDFFEEMARRYPDRVSVTIGFVPEIARKIYAGADMFLMPSQNEPCGLAQMIAMRYGTVPIVRETGGLRDSVTDCGGENGNGFTFKTYNAHDMLNACLRAQALYNDKKAWKKLVDDVMKCDFSWESSSEKYIELYKSLING